MSMTLVGRCVFCKHKTEFAARQTMPMCPKCFSPLVITEATSATSVVPQDDAPKDSPGGTGIRTTE